MHTVRLAALVLTVLTSCVTVSTMSPANRLDAELTTLLEQQNRALESSDLAVFQATIDQERLALRRCASETFDLAARSGRYRLPPFKLQGAEIYRGYARAFVEENGIWRRVYFRQLAGGWVMSEPLRSELGAIQSVRVTDQDTFHYYESDSDIASAIGAGIGDARKFVAAVALAGTSAYVDWRFLPTREVIGFERCGFGGFAIGATSIHLHAITFMPGRSDVDESSRRLLKHELLHLAQMRAVPGAARVAPWWAVEGWPEYVVYKDAGWFYMEPCRTDLPTLQKLGRGVPDGGPDDTAEAWAAYYGHAASLVAHVYQRYGANAYWEFLREYVRFASPGTAYPAAFGVTAEAFYKGWWNNSRDC